VKSKRVHSTLSLLLCGAVLAYGSTSVLAATSSTTPSTTANNQELKISPVRTDLTVEAGATGTVKVVATNLTNAPITVQPIENDFVAGGEQGQPNLILDSNSYAPSHSLKRFMVPMSDITIPANGTMPVTVNIAVPKAAQAGGYFGALRLAPVTAGISGSSAVGLGGSVASLILMTVPGPTTEQLTMTDFAVQQNGNTAGNFRNPSNLNLFVRFENKGNLQEAPFGQVYVQKGKKLVYTYNFNQQNPKSEILPDSFRRWSIPLRGLGKFGKYTVGATFTYGTKGQTIDVSKSVWIIPTGYILAMVGTIIVLVLLIGGGFLFLKSYKRRILKSSRRRY